MKQLMRLLVALLVVIPNTSAHQSGTGLKPLKEPAVVVLSAFIRNQLATKGIDSIRVGEPGSVLAPETLRLKRANAEEANWMKRELPNLRDETIASLQTCASQSYSVGSLAVPVSYHTATQQQMKSAEKLYAAYPKTWGLVQFSCVGFDMSSQQALFFVERVMCRCGVGKFVLMEKSASGEWVIAGEVMRWIA